MTKNDLKISLVDEPKFYINEKKKTVVCLLHGYFIDDYVIDTIESRGKAVCCDEDVFDVEIGKKIAYAKAENIIYKKASLIAVKEYKQCLDRISKLDNFINKSNRCRTHNYEYINKLTD